MAEQRTVLDVTVVFRPEYRDRYAFEAICPQIDTGWDKAHGATPSAALIALAHLVEAGMARTMSQRVEE